MKVISKRKPSSSSRVINNSYMMFNWQSSIQNNIRKVGKKKYGSFGFCLYAISRYIFHFKYEILTKHKQSKRLNFALIWKDIKAVTPKRKNWELIHQKHDKKCSVGRASIIVEKSNINVRTIKTSVSKACWLIKSPC